MVPNSITLYAQTLYQNQCIDGRPQKFFQGGNVEILLILCRLLASENAMQMDLPKTLHYPTSLTSLCWLNWNLSSQSFV